MASIVKTIEMMVYNPTFNPDSGLYEDICPYKHRERNRAIFTCRCKAGTEISSIPQYRSHINSSCHKSFIENYSLFKREINEEKEFNKKLKYDNEILTRKLNKKEEENKELITRYEKVLKSFKKYYDHNRKQTDKYKNIINEIIQEDY